jgi:hypothetical protein
VAENLVGIGGVVAESQTVDATAESPTWAAEWAAHFLTVAAAFLIVWVIASTCTLTIKVDQKRVADLLPSLAVPPDHVAPEPAERTAYCLSLMCVPVFMLLIHPIVRAKVTRLPADVIWRCFLASCIAMLLLIGWGALGDGGFYWSGSLLRTNPIAFVLATIAGVALTQFPFGELLTAADHRRLLLVRDVGLATAVVALTGVTSILRVISGADRYVTDNHFEAVFFASTQVALGATLLVDLPHQYGLYPEFLAPVFHLLGGITVERFTVVMAILQAVASMLWLAALLRVMRTPWLAMITFLGAFSLVGFLVPLFVIRQNFIPYYDPYFQYFPVRSLFPAVSLYAMAWISERDRFGNRAARCLPGAILGAGVLWNADAGVPALGAWVMCLCHQALVRRQGDPPSIVAAIRVAATAAVEALLCAAIAMALVLALLAWKGGAWPNLTMYWRHQRVFYEIGFYMLPMRLMHSWVAWAAVIMAALSFGIWPLSTSDGADRQPIRSTLFGWAILACGLFSYYQGRSHDWVFPVVLPIALALVAVAIARLALPASLDRRMPHRWRLAGGVLTAAFVVVMASGAVGPWSDKLFWQLVQHRWRGFATPAAASPEPVAIAFVKQRLTPGEDPLILSNHAGVYHAATRTRSQLPTSLIELVLRSDLDDLLRTIAGKKRIFADRSVLAIQTPNTNQQTNALLVAELEKRFRPVARSADGYMFEFVPREATSPTPAR